MTYNEKQEMQRKLIRSMGLDPKDIPPLDPIAEQELKVAALIAIAKSLQNIARSLREMQPP